MTAPRPPIYILTRLWVDLTQDIRWTYTSETDERVALDQTDVFILSLVHLATVDQRHTNVSELARRAWVSRPTLFRRIETLQKMGLVELVGQAWRMTLSARTRAEQHDLTAMIEAFKAALDELRFRRVI